MCHRSIQVPRYAKGEGDEATHKFLGFIGSCVDVTDLKLAKINADKMAQAKTNFLANMRYPLTRTTHARHTHDTRTTHARHTTRHDQRHDTPTAHATRHDTQKDANVRVGLVTRFVRR
jgi:hypothetical protein